MEHKQENTAKNILKEKSKEEVTLWNRLYSYSRTLKSIVIWKKWIIQHVGRQLGDHLGKKLSWIHSCLYHTKINFKWVKCLIVKIEPYI